MAGAARARGGAQAVGGATLADAWRPVFMALNQVWEMGGAVRLRGLGCALAGTVLVLSLFTRHADDSSWNAAGGEAPRNLLGGFGATLSDVSFQSVGF
ncbi:MAG: DNA translocase FtsK 4TM domain-containing protein, partial [Pseudomonadota bacterium]|nr:DNA translocase FtsK 4TM domain-containing protein [Pseudomonadota bacterium]